MGKYKLEWYQIIVIFVFLIIMFFLLLSNNVKVIINV